MKNYLKRIILLPALMFLLSLGLIGCGGDSSVLLNEYYLKANLDNNYEEIKIKSENLDSEKYEVKLEEDLISIIDKKSKGLDKIEYVFDEEDNLLDIKFRRNAKDVSFSKYGEEELHYINGYTIVDSMKIQCDFLNDKEISDQNIIKIDIMLLDIYTRVNLEWKLYETREYLKSIEAINGNYKYSEGLKGEDENKLSLTNTKNNAKIVVEYKNKSEDEGDSSLPIEKIVYYAEGGKIIEANMETRGKVSSLKTYNNIDSEGIEVGDLQEQVDFLKNNSL